MADEVVESDEEAGPSPETHAERRGGWGILVFAMLLMIAVLIGAWFMLNRHHNELRPADAAERAK